MAERGGQLGNQNAVKAKRWQLAIDAALETRSRAEGVEALERLAEKLLMKCEQGDVTALKELGDRMDGKPAQVITGENGDPLFQIGEIKVTVVDPK